MEGKEVRFGIANSALFATVTTDASCGAVNTMHDSLMPLGGMIPMVNIMPFGMCASQLSIARPKIRNGTPLCRKWAATESP